MEELPDPGDLALGKLLGCASGQDTSLLLVEKDYPFGGGKDAQMLNEIRGIVQAWQLSNMAAFVPTDCQTR